MSWWSMITTKGRLLTDVQLVYQEGEIRISEYRFQEGEELAILIDASRNRARLYAPFEECQALASRHQYELCVRRQPEETFASYIERLLAVEAP